MHRILPLILLLALSSTASAIDLPNPFKKDKEELTPDDILSLVRYSYTLHDREFQAQLRKEFTTVPFTLHLRPQYIRFRFVEPPQAIHLDTSAQQLVLREVVEDSNAPVPIARYGEVIRGTDITYEDLSMRFLYWPDPRVVDEELVYNKTRPSWKLKLTNPDERGPYGFLYIWIDKMSGGMIKMEGYDRSPNPVMVKDFEVKGGKKFEDVWIADTIRVRSYTADGKEGTTWLEILNLNE